MMSSKLDPKEWHLQLTLVKTHHHHSLSVNTGGVSAFFLKSANKNAAVPSPSTTKYFQASIGVPGGALDLGGTRAIGTSAMADDGVPRFAEIPRNPQFGTC